MKQQESSFTIILSAQKRWIDRKKQTAFLWVYGIELLVWAIFGHKIYLILLGTALYNIGQGLFVYYKYWKGKPKKGHVFSFWPNGQKGIVKKVVSKNGCNTITISPLNKN